MAAATPIEEFASLPLTAQVAQLRARLAVEDPRALLELTAAVRDHAPLAWLCRELLERGWLGEPEGRAHLARFLVGQPATAVDKVLRAVVGRGGPRAQRDLAETLVEVLRLVPVAGLSSMCLVDRFLKHNLTELRDRYVGSVVDECVEALRAGRLEDVTVHRLAQVPARAMDELAAAAAEAGPEVAAAFEATRQGLARAVVEVLGSAPKAVSQANAEELLSRRVYTDPGHFLIELLQNAEDAGAVTWRLTFDSHRIVVWHDGTPFDARDVVGVTSIGQTTKRKQQIGFFGVGFKAVYEVTDRPQIYSDVYDFEIADVSIPKALATRPADLPEEGTAVVLPLRDPDDPVRCPRALYDKARALDPVVLFTLRDVDRIELELTAAAGGPERYAIQELVEPDDGRSVIRQEPGGWRRSFALEDDEFTYDAGLREPGRPDRTKVMVGILLDEAGAPRPLEPDASTVYSYLPTAEHSGLRFFVQGHFDVPVDRERITRDSAWNRWILSKVPGQLAQLSERLAAGVEGAARLRVARGLLDVLPLAAELASPIFRVVSRRLPRAFADLPVLPATDGMLHRPAETVVASPAIAALFDGAPAAAPGEGPRYFLDAGLDERGVAVARSLGCGELDLDDLVALLEAQLAGVAEGGRPADPAAPALLRGPTPEGMIRLYEALEGELAALERSGQRIAASRCLSRLEALPIVLGVDGGLHRPRLPSGLRAATGEPPIRAVFAGLRTFLHPDLESRVEPGGEGEGGDEAPPATAGGAFLERVGVERLEVRHVVRALEEELRGLAGPLEGPEAVAFPGSAERLERIMEVVAEAPHGLLVRLARLPLFPAEDGRLWRAAARQQDRGGVLAVDPDGAGAELRALYGGSRPIAAATCPAAAATLLSRVRAPALGFDTLLADLGDPEGPLARDLGGLRRLHELLESLRGEIPLRARSELARLPIWPDTTGRGRPLRGEGAVHIPAHEQVLELFPFAPFVDPEVRGRAHLRDMGVDAVGAAAVVDALSPEARLPLKIEPTPSAVEAVLAYLLEHGESLGRRSRDRLAGLSAFLSDRGVPAPLAELFLPTSVRLRALYGEFDGRRFVAPEGLTMRVVRALDLEGRLAEADAATLVSDLHAARDRLLGRRPGEAPLPILDGPDRLAELHSCLAERAADLAPAVVRRAVGLAVFPDSSGRLGLLRGAPGERSRAEDEVVPSEPELRDLLEAAGVRLLHGEAQARLAPLLEAAGTPLAGLETLVEVLAELEARGGGPPRALADHPVLCDPDRRRRFYAWLAAHEGAAFRDPTFRARLEAAALFPTERGRLVAPRELVVDPDLPDLGIDFRPHPEIPEAVLGLLARHLDVGRPEPEALVRQHLLPAYGRAVGADDRGRAGELFAYLARTLEGRSALELRALLRPGEPGGLVVEDHARAFRPPGDLLLPLDEIAGYAASVFGEGFPRPSEARYAEEQRGFLLRLGVRREPSLESVARAVEAGPVGGGEAAALGLAGLVGHVYRQDPEAAERTLPLRSAAWVADGTGCLRRPADLYLWSPEIEALLGDFGELYPDPRVPPLLGEGLVQALGFRGGRDVRVEEVVRHVRARAASGALVPFRVYQWIDQGLDAGALAGLLGSSPWICADDGTWWPHRAVLGVSAIRYFGERRGYWAKGAERCPALCRAFHIAAEVTPRVVVEFLQELGAQVAAEGDRAVLEAEPALPRMLVACFGALGREPTRISPSLPVVLCTEQGGGEGGASATLRLLPPREPRLLRSDTPTLEALFAGVGRLYLAVRGSVDEREELDRFFEANGIRRLREAYSIEVDEAGRDCTEARGAEIARLRALLRALAAVVPRVRAQRTLLDEEGWVDSARLRPLAAGGTIRAIEGLEVAYSLPEVGRARADVEAVWDPAREELLVDAAVLDDPAAHATGLAVGLMRCVYDGSGEDQVVDIIEILLALRTRERMEAYLDRRHFPEGVEGTERSPAELLAERIDEILDYGLDARLAERYVELRGKDLEAWREPGLVDRALASEEEAPEDLAAAARRALAPLLDASEVAEPSTALQEALLALLSAPSLADVPPSLYTASSPTEDDDGLRPIAAPRGARGGDVSWSGSPIGASSGPPGSAAEPSAGLSPPSFEELLERFERIAAKAGEAGQEVAAPPSRPVVSSSRPAEPPPPPPPPSSTWWRLRRLLGLGKAEDILDLASPPPWSAPAASPFAPSRGVPSQLWATRETRAAMSSVPLTGQLSFAPARLPPPYRYAAHALGATFDPATQSWSAAGMPRSLAELCPGRPTGRIVPFQGPLPPGDGRLPVPLYARLVRMPEVVHGPAGALQVLDREGVGPLPVRVRAESQVVVRYEVELLRAPVLSAASRAKDLAVSSAVALVTPTTSASELPGEVRDWLASRRAADRPPWELAVAARDLVQRRYAYDDAFMERRAVRRKLRRLSPGRGNHHLALLHASRGDGVLGRGICYELNTLVAELLRHLGVPCVVATGWVLVDGVLDRPDHLFALALLPTAEGDGTCLLPLDAAVGPAGPIRPIAHAPAASGPGAAWGLDPAPPVPDLPGPWSAPGATSGAHAPTGVEAARRAEEARLASEEALLRRVVVLASRARGVEPPAADGTEPSSDRPLHERVGALRAQAESLLSSPGQVEALVAVMRGEADRLPALTDELRALVRAGLAHVREVPTHQLWAADERPPYVAPEE